MPNEIWDKRAMDTIDATLAAKGWTKVESGGDVGVVALGTTEQQQSVNTFYNSYGAGWGWGWRGWGGMGTATTTVSTYNVGTLVVDMFDAKSKQLVWRGTANDTISGSPEKNQQKLTNAVEKLFSDFPPGSASK